MNSTFNAWRLEPEDALSDEMLRSLYLDRFFLDRTDHLFQAVDQSLGGLLFFLSVLQ